MSSTAASGSKRIVLITGCSTGGIGYALCEEFALQGCKVYASSRKIESIKDFSTPSLFPVEKVSIDVTSDESIRAALDLIMEKEGQIDVVVNNAGAICPGPIVEQSIDAVRRTFETNTFGILRMTNLVVPLMARRKSGTIVNIGSIVGEISTPWNGIYCASKAAANTISEVMSMELRPLGINVLHVAPCSVKSNIANNAAHFSLSPNSLYTTYLPNIIKRIYISQGSNSMPTAQFAKGVVSRALRAGGPPLYFSAGGSEWTFRLFKWLPKAFVLWYMWRIYSQKM
ncbi:oxidoreductase [Crepidotus variabilis]|uniref:Oxidoreductase n=1 Tax=Crepidotus variabilis TaxID=179855 RepID=A0A9P6EEU6_9AGAR|nr:oxidoreductase [Crepidotus variabilis]